MISTCLEVAQICGSMTETQRGERIALGSHGVLRTELGLGHMTELVPLQCIAHGCCPSKSKGIGRINPSSSLCSVLNQIKGEKHTLGKKTQPGSLHTSEERGQETKRINH